MSTVVLLMAACRSLGAAVDGLINEEGGFFSGDVDGPGRVSDIPLGDHALDLIDVLRRSCDEERIAIFDPFDLFDRRESVKAWNIRRT